MNFLSHFYFERYSSNAEQVFGALLPDLLKNADKTYVLRPRQFEEQLTDNPLLKSIFTGWNRHIEVDRLFHNTDFFFRHSHQLKVRIVPILAGLPIRPSFMAHIALELLLDHILAQKKEVSIDRFYMSLRLVDRSALWKFLRISQLEDVTKFQRFYQQFIDSQYIYQYNEINKITGALFNICRRLWQFEVNDAQRMNLAVVLKVYVDENLNDFHDIYHYIQYQLIDFN